MNMMTVFLIGVTVVAGLLAPLAVADEVTPAKLAEQCKKEAQETGVHPGDVAAYIKECLSDYGVEAAEAEKIVEQMKLKDQNDN